MLGAMEAGVNRAALEHSVPRTTLKDRLSGRIIHGSNIGPKPYLTQDEEKELAKFLINCFKMGYGKTRGEVLKIVEAVVKKKGRKHEGPISQGWWCCFRHRWPQLSLRRGDSFSIAHEKKNRTRTKERHQKRFLVSILYLLYLETGGSYLESSLDL